MKVLLLQNIARFGRIGEIKEVSDGHARNFLLPNKLAILATPEAIAQQRSITTKKIRHQSEKTKSHKKLMTRINAASLNFVVQANSAGVLYGAITTTVIKQKLQELGIIISEDQIVNFSPIKEIGTHQVKIALDPEFQAKLKVIVKQLLDH